LFATSYHSNRLVTTQYHSNHLVTTQYSVYTQHAKKLVQVQPKLVQALKEGVLQDVYVLDNISKLMAFIREANVSIRWLMLHTQVLSTGE